METSKVYKISAYHNKQMSLGFDDIFVSKKGLESFKENFKKNYSGGYIETRETSFLLEDNIVVTWEEFEMPELIDEFNPDMEIHVSDGGYDDTYLEIENLTGDEG